MSPADFNFYKLFKSTARGGLPQLQQRIADIINWLVVIFIIASFVYLVLAGIKYITSQGDATKATEARRAIIYAVIGIVVATLALFIINAVASFVGSL